MIAPSLQAIYLALSVCASFGLAAPAKRTDYPTVSRDDLLGDQSRYWASKRNFDTSAPPQVREYKFDMSVGYAPVGGISKRTLLVNGMSPGPMIEANVGDNIVVHVHNGMPNGTALHWHGMRQVGTNFMDGAAGFTQCAIPGGEDFTYNFTVADPGTYWWHSHVGLQYSDGAFGGLITHAKDEKDKFPAYDDDHYLLLGDLYNTPTDALAWRFFSPSGITGIPILEPMPDGGYINGVSQARCAYVPSNRPPPPPDPNAPPAPGPPLPPAPQLPPGYPIYEATNECGDHPTMYWNVNMKPHKTYRLRLVNSGTHADQIFSIDDHKLTVIEIDGTPVEPYETKRVRLAVGQRASVLVKTDTPGAHWIRSALGLDQMLYFGPDTSNVTLAVMRYGVDDDTMPSIPAAEAVATTGGLTYGDGSGGPAVDPGPVDPDAPTWSDAAATVGPMTRFYPVCVPNPPPSTQSVVTFMDLVPTDKGMRVAINNHTWFPMEDNAAVFLVQDGQEVGNDGAERGSQFNILNTDAGAVMDVVLQVPGGPAHPFHLHGHSVWIMSQGYGLYNGTTNDLPTDNPVYRDVAVIPGGPTGGHVVLRFKADNPGVWPFHCHMQWHMALGLLFSLTSLPDQMTWDLPGREFCKALGH